MAQLKIRGLQRIYTIQEHEALEIKEIWRSDQYRPDYKIEIGSLTFRKSDIQIIEMEDIVFSKRGIDLSDPIQREEVQKFEKEFNDFCKDQPEFQRTFEHFLQDKKIISFGQPPRIAQSGMERFNLGSVILHNPVSYGDYFQKYNAMNSLRNYEEKKLPPDIQTQKETLFESDEINVNDIPF